LIFVDTGEISNATTLNSTQTSNLSNPDWGHWSRDVALSPSQLTIIGPSKDNWYSYRLQMKVLVMAFVHWLEKGVSLELLM